MIVRRTGRTVRSLGRPGYNCGEDKEEGEEYG